MLPFIVFKSKDDHQRALNIWANIATQNESASLEQRVHGTIIKLDGKDSEAHQGVYLLSPVFLSIFNDSGVKYDVLDTPQKIGEHLSDAGKEELGCVLKYRRDEISRSQN